MPTSSKEYNRNYYLKHREKINQYFKNYYHTKLKNNEDHIKRRNEYYKRTHPNKQIYNKTNITNCINRKEYNRKYYLKRKYEKLYNNTNEKASLRVTFD